LFAYSKVKLLYPLWFTSLINIFLWSICSNWCLSGLIIVCRILTFHKINIWGLRHILKVSIFLFIFLSELTIIWFLLLFWRFRLDWLPYSTVFWWWAECSLHFTNVWWLDLWWWFWLVSTLSQFLFCSYIWFWYWAWNLSLILFLDSIWWLHSILTSHSWDLFLILKIWE